MDQIRGSLEIVGHIAAIEALITSDPSIMLEGVRQLLRARNERTGMEPLR